MGESSAKARRRFASGETKDERRSSSCVGAFQSRALEQPSAIFKQHQPKVVLSGRRGRSVRLVEDSRPSHIGGFGEVIPGAFVGRYLLRSELGYGEQGRVFAAYDPQLDRRVALKFFCADLTQDITEILSTRSQRMWEAQAMAKIGHPHVVPIYDVGIWNDELYIAMEFVHGVNLRLWLHQRRRTWRELLALFRKIADGLIEIHREGLVHRDIRPENIMVREDGHPFILDFGLANTPMAAAEDKRWMTLTSQDSVTSQRRAKLAAGTGSRALHYSPPRMEGDPEADTRADQFGFCVAFFEALYGVLPFPGRTRRAVLRQMRFRDLQKLPRRRSVPTWLHQILLRGLSADAELRFSSMTELVSAIDRQRGYARLRQKVAGITALGGLGTALAISVVQLDAPKDCNDANLRLGGAWSPTVSDAVHRMMNQMGPSYVEVIWPRLSGVLDSYRESWLTQYEVVCRSVDKLDEEATPSSFANFDLQMACLDRSRAALRTLTELLEEGDPQVMRESISVATSLPLVEQCRFETVHTRGHQRVKDPAQREQIAEIQRELERIRIVEKAGRSMEATDRLDTLLDRARTLGDPATIAELLLLLVIFQDSIAPDWFADAHRLEESVALASSDRDYKIAAEAAIALVIAHIHGRWDDDATDQWIGRARALVRAAGSPPLLSAKLDRAEGVTESIVRLRPDKALELYQRAVSTLESTEQQDTSLYALTLEDIAFSYAQRHEHEAASYYHRESLDAFLRILGEGHPTITRKMLASSHHHRQVGDFEAAIASTRDAVHNCEQGIFLDPDTCNYAIDELARNHAVRGELSQGIALIDQLQRAHEGPNGNWLHYEELTRTRSQFAIESGETSIAEELMLELDRRTHARNDDAALRSGPTRRYLAEALAAAGRGDEARNVLGNLSSEIRDETAVLNFALPRLTLAEAKVALTLGDDAFVLEHFVPVRDEILDHRTDAIDQSWEYNAAWMVAQACRSLKMFDCAEIELHRARRVLDGATGIHEAVWIAYWTERVALDIDRENYVEAHQNAERFLTSIHQADISYRSQLLLPLQYYFEKAKFLLQPTKSQFEQLRTVLAQWRAWQSGDEARLVRELARVDALEVQMRRASSQTNQRQGLHAQLAAKRALEVSSWKNNDAVFASWVGSDE